MPGALNGADRVVDDYLFMYYKLFQVTSIYHWC